MPHRPVEELLGWIRSVVPDVTVRTTFITGFPGETEAEHKHVVRSIETLGFGRIDDQGWQHLRALCPAEREKSSLDELVATRLLDTPTIYHAAITSMQPAEGSRLSASVR